MEINDQSSRVERAGESAAGHPVGRESDPTNRQQDQGRQINRRAGEDGKAINKAREAEKTTPQADSVDESAEDKPRQPEDSATSGKENSKMEKLLQQVLVGLERHRAENALFRADVTKQLADQREENALFRADVTKQLADQRQEFLERDAARAKETADQRADFMDRDAARGKEIADLRTDIANSQAATARGFQHMTMWLAGVLLGIFAVLVAVVGVGIQLID